MTVPPLKKNQNQNPFRKYLTFLESKLLYMHPPEYLPVYSGVSKIKAFEIILIGVSDLDFSRFLCELLIIMPPIICEKIFCCHTDSMSDRFFSHHFI